jgi:hypothetical protein
MYDIVENIVTKGNDALEYTNAWKDQLTKFNNVESRYQAKYQQSMQTQQPAQANALSQKGAFDFKQDKTQRQQAAKASSQKSSQSRSTSLNPLSA